MAEPEQDIGEKPAELVLKVRIQNPKENDFIEIELKRQELSYQNLLKVSCCELGINQNQPTRLNRDNRRPANIAFSVPPSQ